MRKCGRTVRDAPPDGATVLPDAVHPEWQSRPAHGRVLRGDRPAVRSTTGRRRRTRTGRRIRGRWSPRRAGAGGPAPPRLRGFPGTGARPSRRRGGPRPAGQRPPPSREGAQALPGAAGMPRPAALPAAPRAAPDPTGRLWGVMHRHVRRDRLHADPRRSTGAILRFPDGALPREREATAESVTGGFRVVTHDGHRMAR